MSKSPKSSFSNIFQADSAEVVSEDFLGSGWDVGGGGGATGIPAAVEEAAELMFLLGILLSLILCIASKDCNAGRFLRFSNRLSRRPSTLCSASGAAVSFLDSISFLASTLGTVFFSCGAFFLANLDFRSCWAYAV